MAIEDTKLTTEVGSIREVNLYLLSGWVLIQTYVQQTNGAQSPRYVLAWQSPDEPARPELLDRWELSEIDRQRYT
jgi:hypothetical protein